MIDPLRSGLPRALGACLLFVAAATAAQDGAAPVLSAVFPPGLTIGGRETWTLQGRDLGRVETIEVDGGGVEVVVKDANARQIVAVARAGDGAAAGFRAVRVRGPDGVSNPRTIRVDRLGQTREREPNDRATEATPLPRGDAGVGVLGPQDLDHFRVEARGGERVAIEVEARRLGVPVAPVVTVITADGRALVQGRDTPGVEGDCRFSYTFPADASYLIQVRDNLYAGAVGACYRLRVTADPFATGLFPLGGPPGAPVTVTASGGNLPRPLRQTLTLPDKPGAIVELPPFGGPRGAVFAPGRLVVGDGPELHEPTSNGEGPALLALLRAVSTVNGRIERPGEVDRYRVRVRKGETRRYRILAAPLGSRLDSVLTVRDSRGTVLAENDDAAIPPRGSTDTDPDSRIELKAEADEDRLVEVTDRFGQGGPEYSYRLTVGPIVPEFSIRLSLNNNQPGPTGAFTLKPGNELSIPFTIVREGRMGPIRVRAEGLPEGVSSPPAVLRSPPRGTSKASPRLGNIVVLTGALTLRAARGARAASGRFRVVGVSMLEDGRSLERVASATIRDDSVPIPGPVRPVFLRLTSFPVMTIERSSDGTGH